jgi:NAD(P)-dependent dehydrogenase (short-subunit alcohol dehydrogenase family)
VGHDVCGLVGVRVNFKLKPLSHQVIVITGASSGIGLATAREAARRGARLVLAARNEDALREVCDELQQQGHDAVYVVADVGSLPEVRRIAEAAVARFGRFDTWINNAGVTIYGKVEDVSEADAVRLFQTNFWGTFHGSRIAVEHLKRDRGALINVGSDLSEHAVPLMGLYSASKHAVLGLTDALRVELEREGAQVAVTLVRPSGIDTQIVPHAKNYLDVEPSLPAPVYAPGVVARAILHAAEHPTRDIFAGGAARLLSTITHLAPRISDWVLRRFIYDEMTKDQPPRFKGQDGLHATAGRTPRERYGSNRIVLERSLYTQAAMHPRLTTAAALGAGIGAALLLLKAFGPAPSRRAADRHGGGTRRWAVR